MIANEATSHRSTTTALLLSAVLLSVGCGSDPPELPAGPEARVTVDFDAQRLVAEREDLRLDEPLPADVADTLDELRAVLATGRDDPALRARVGRALLEPIEQALRDAPRWVWRGAGTDPVPGSLATLPAWILPWHRDQPVAAHHTVRLDWPADLAAPVPRTDPRARGDRLLLVAPFREGVAPHRDDPDTLRHGLRAAVAHVDLLPRNDSDAPALRRTLEDDEHAWVWLRATPRGLATLRPAFGALPGAVVWTLPGGLDPGSRPVLAPSTLASGGIGPALVVVGSWPVAGSALGRLVRPWMELVTRGVPADLALTEARREAIRSGQPVHVWSVLIAVGRTEGLAPPARATWLRRRLGSRGGPGPRSGRSEFLERSRILSASAPVPAPN
ncbi:MAG TPA: hypothetical protein VKA86_08695 [Candidatus Krumholzibacteria bacterium]|nr:hypothetical protein [Candidatus Krumholzibacteria bacterium]